MDKDNREVYTLLCDLENDSFVVQENSSIVRKAAQVWQAETNSIEERNEAMPSVGFISARSRSWNKRSARRADTSKTKKKLAFKWSFSYLTNSVHLQNIPDDASVSCAEHL